MFCTSRKYVYQYGDTTAVVEHGSGKNPILHLFLFTQNKPHNYYNCNFKKQFLPRVFYRNSKGYCLFHIVELDYLFSNRYDIAFNGLRDRGGSRQRKLVDMALFLHISILSTEVVKGIPMKSLLIIAIPI